jgi:hypothetical protein
LAADASPLGWLSFGIVGPFWGPFPSTTTAHCTMLLSGALIIVPAMAAAIAIAAALRRSFAP